MVAEGVAAALRVRVRALGIGLAAASMLSVAWCVSPWWVPKAYPPAAIPSHSYREYHLLKQHLHALTDGAPIILGVHNVVTYLWLEYFLCDQPIHTLEPVCRVPILIPLAGGVPGVVRPALHEARFLLTDGLSLPAGVGDSWVPVCRSQSFCLWRRCGSGDAPVRPANPGTTAVASGRS
jgi:hypothetical protein